MAAPKATCSICGRTVNVEPSPGTNGTKYPLTELPYGWVGVTVTSRDGRTLALVICPSDRVKVGPVLRQVARGGRL